MVRSSIYNKNFGSETLQKPWAFEVTTSTRLELNEQVHKALQGLE